MCYLEIKRDCWENISDTDVAVIKALGRQVKGYNDSYWNGVRQLLVYEGLKEKFAQNDDG